VDVKIFIAVWK